MNLNYVTRRKIIVSAIFSAVSFILMLLQFSVPVMPGFIKLDFSELPALIAAFAYGPWWGVLICFIKNVLHLPFTTTFCIGELSNFLLGAFFVLPAGYIYKLKKCKSFALIGAAAGAFIMALASFPINYFITYPVYSEFMPVIEIVNAYRKILPSLNLGDDPVANLRSVLFIFNVPFNFVKGLLNTVIAIFIYKPLSPIIKGISVSKSSKKASKKKHYS